MDSDKTTAAKGQAGEPLHLDRFPAELMAIPHWVLWRDATGRKVPYQAIQPRKPASVAKPGTWASFSQTAGAYRRGRDAGLGFVLTEELKLACVDIDDLDTRDNVARGLRLLRSIGCKYIEVSPSGNGLHGWGYYTGKTLPKHVGTWDGLSVEAYTSKRYMTVTGAAFDAAGFAELHSLHALMSNLDGAPQEDDSATQEGNLAPVATQETQETKETKETQETQDTQARGGQQQRRPKIGKIGA